MTDPADTIHSLGAKVVPIFSGQPNYITFATLILLLSSHCKGVGLSAPAAASLISKAISLSPIWNDTN